LIKYARALEISDHHAEEMEKQHRPSGGSVSKHQTRLSANGYKVNKHKLVIIVEGVPPPRQALPRCRHARPVIIAQKLDISLEFVSLNKHQSVENLECLGTNINRRQTS
jgi:hypothetical protein